MLKNNYLLQKFKLWRLKQTSSVPGIADVLRIALGEVGFSNIQLKCEDPKLLPEAVASALECSDDELLRYIAGLLNLDYHTRVHSLNPDKLPEGFHLVDFKRVGAIPLIRNGGVSGIVCVDPALIREFLSYNGGIPVFLATWPNIAQALERTEKAIIRERDEERKRRDRDFSQAAEEVAGTVINEARSFGANHVEIDFAADPIVYRFQTGQGREAEGTIQGVIRKPLQSLLHIWSTEQSDLRIVKNDLEGTVLVVFQNTEEKAVLQENAPEEPVELQQVKTAQLKQGPPVVFVIEDNASFARVMKRFLEEQGYRVVIAEDGKRAFSLLETARTLPDLILSASQLPGMSGYEVLNHIRTDFQLRHIPLIILASDNDFEMELRLLERGADACISKSSDPRLLGAQIARLLKRDAKKKAA